MREDLTARSWLVWATLLLSVCAMVGVLLPWAHGLELRASGLGRSSVYGFEYAQGVAALTGALGLVIVSALRASRRIGDVPYVAFGTVMCVLSLAASIWFWNVAVGAVDPINNSGSVSFFRPPRMSVGEGWRLTFASLLAAQLCLFVFAIDAMSIRVVHDDREFAGGSLLPDRLRFRVVRRVHTTH